MGGAEALVKCIGRLPLVISHAASFTKQSHQHLDGVLSLYQSKHKCDVRFSHYAMIYIHVLMAGKLIRWNNELSSYEQKSVAVTFATQLEELHHLSLIAYESITDTSAPNATTSVLRIYDLVQFMIQECVRRENTHHRWF